MFNTCTFAGILLYENILPQTACDQCCSQSCGFEPCLAHLLESHDQLEESQLVCTPGA